MARFGPFLALSEGWLETIKGVQALNAPWYLPHHGFTDEDAAILKS
jgi:hypothetical protein